MKLTDQITNLIESSSFNKWLDTFIEEKGYRPLMITIQSMAMMEKR